MVFLHMQNHAESDLEAIQQVCDKCLMNHMRLEFHSFRSKAIILEPTSDNPCYVFQPLDELVSISSNSFVEDAHSLLAHMNHNCESCALRPRFLWVHCKKLNDNESSHFWKDGISAVLLGMGLQPPKSLCADCCVNLLQKYFPPMQFLEICFPKAKDGVQISMGY